MTDQMQRLNLKWTQADIDLLKGLARSGKSATEIVERIKARGITATPNEVRTICFQAGTPIRAR